MAVSFVLDNGEVVALYAMAKHIINDIFYVPYDYITLSTIIINNVESVYKWNLPTYVIVFDDDEFDIIKGMSMKLEIRRFMSESPKVEDNDRAVKMMEDISKFKHRNKVV